MITIDKISIDFSGKYIFKDISLQIKIGDKIGLIGNNGSGKTTFLKLISKIENPSIGKIKVKKHMQIGYLAQEVSFNQNISLKSLVLGNNQQINIIENRINEINIILEKNDLNKNKQLLLLNEVGDLYEKLEIIQNQNKEIKAEKIMKGLGFKRSDFNRKISYFSGGWMMRAELSRLLVLNPDILLLDEPTNHLDLPSIIWLEKFLLNLNCIIVLVSHDKNFIDKIINRTFEVTNAKIKDFSGNYSKYISYREKEISHQIKDKKKQNKYKDNSIKLIEKFRYKKNKAAFAQTLIRRLEKIEEVEVDDFDISKISFNFPPPTHSGHVIYKCIDLSKSYNNNLVFDNVNLDIYKGDKIAFVGKNGYGKTTLTKIINNEITFEGRSKIGEKVQINYFAQNQNELLDKESTIIEFIERTAPNKKQSELRGLLGAFLFSGDDVYKKIKILSGGEKARLSLCSILLIPGNLLILDEPTNHLDMFAKDILKHALKQYKGTVIIVSHDRDFLNGLAERVIEFDNKRVREFPGDIDVYLNQNKESNILEDSSKVIIKQKTGKILYQTRKKIDKKIRQLNRINSIIETKINELELKISKFKNTLNEPDVGNIDYNQFEQLNEELNLEMNNWEELQEEINNMVEKRKNLPKIG